MLRLYDTLTRRVREFRPVRPPHVGVYSCGPTVYRYVHIGNLRTYLMADWLRRALGRQGYRVRLVKNITDVGHMRQEMLERGEDKVIAAALAEGKTPEEIAQFYTEAFQSDERKLNILPATLYPRASDHVDQMLAVIEKLQARGLAYEAQGNVYFDVARFPNYGRLSGTRGAGLLEGVRAEADPLKKDPRDFALWKAAEPGRAMKWPSPWGEGFPGWHIECSAMSTFHLGEEVDIHTGGVDNIFPHHEDEIAQSEGAFGHEVVRHWLHGQHLLVDGIKMAKSSGNVYTLADLEDRGFDPLAFRYLCLTVHYRHRLNFTFTALRAAARGLQRLREAAFLLGREGNGRQGPVDDWRQRFWDAVDDDLGMPRALAVIWEMLRSGLPAAGKRALLAEFDEVMGLALESRPAEEEAVLGRLEPLLERRQRLRRAGDFADADSLRHEIEDAGYHVRDGLGESHLVPLACPAGLESAGLISSSRDVESLLDEPDSCEFSVNVVARDDVDNLRRAVESVLSRPNGHSVELVAVDNGSRDGSGEWLERLAAGDSRVEAILCDHNLGTAAGRNVALRRSRGRYVVCLDTSVEVVGDVFTPLAEALADGSVGIAGGWGVKTDDLRTFHESRARLVDAVEGYLMAFRRERVREVGLMDEKYRFYRHLDLDYSFALRARGYHNVLVPGLPLQRHEHSEWARLPHEERDRLSKRNFYRFLKKWGGRTDLLVRGSGRRR